MQTARAMPMSRRDKRIGALIHGYYVHALIGWGGSSKVYRACNYDTLTRVAVKIISKPRSRIGYHTWGSFVLRLKRLLQGLATVILRVRCPC